MSDRVLFAAVPYIAALGFALAAALRCAVRFRRPEAAADGRQPAAWSLAPIVAAACGLGLLMEHVVLLAAPDLVLYWNRSMSRLLMLESAGICLGTVCFLRVVDRMRRHLAAASRATAASLADIIALTLIAMEIASGIGLAVLYRWASSWSVVTLTPYAASLLTFNPRVELVAATPFLARLHVFCTFALVAVVPFTAVGSDALAAIARVAAGTTASLRRACAPAYGAVEAWGKRTVRSGSMWHEEEH